MDKDEVYVSVIAILMVIIIALSLALWSATSAPPPDLTGTIEKPIVVVLPEEIPLELQGVGSVSGTLGFYGIEVAVFSSGPGWGRHEAFYPEEGGTLVLTWTHESYYFHQLKFMSRTCYQIRDQVFSFSLNREGDGSLYYQVTPCNIVSK